MLSEHWVCELNDDPRRNDCDATEEEYSEEAEDEDEDEDAVEAARQRVQQRRQQREQRGKDKGAIKGGEGGIEGGEGVQVTDEHKAATWRCRALKGEKGVRLAQPVRGAERREVRHAQAHATHTHEHVAVVEWRSSHRMLQLDRHARRNAEVVPGARLKQDRVLKPPGACEQGEGADEGDNRRSLEAIRQVGNPKVMGAQVGNPKVMGAFRRGPVPVRPPIHLIEAEHVDAARDEPSADAAQPVRSERAAVQHIPVQQPQREARRGARPVSWYL